MNDNICFEELLEILKKMGYEIDFKNEELKNFKYFGKRILEQKHEKDSYFDNIERRYTKKEELLTEEDVIIK